MREPYHQLHIHLVWSTWDRLPVLTVERRDSVYACIQGECLRLKAELLAIGGIADHIHLLIRIPPAISVAMLVKQLKGVSSHLATHRLGTEQFFKWQGGYSVFAVSKADVPRVRAYILNQEQHHQDKTTDQEWEPTE